MNLFNKFTKRFIHSIFLLKRSMTLGVRALIINDKNEVLLVKHTYIEGWYFPGGGVERGENSIEAVKKELMEEANITLTAEPHIISFHFNNRTSPWDHVALYRCDGWQQSSMPTPNNEIADIKFFPLDDLPDDTTQSTRARINEVFKDHEISPYW